MKQTQLKKLCSFLCVFLSLLLISSATMAQEAKKITGKLYTKDGTSLYGATIIVKGTKTVVSADEKGAFTIYAKPGETIVISFVGRLSQSVKVTETTSDLSIELKADYAKSDEVVVVGYGKAKRKDLTGAIASIGEEDIKRTVSTTVDQALQGRVAGVVVSQNSGQPGGGVSVQVRGTSTLGLSQSPLYIIDGVIIPDNHLNDFYTGNSAAGSVNRNSNPLSNISPNDIATIDVLKDASATAIYGSQGSNGVVIITTKRGKVGAPKISYETYFGIQSLSKDVPTMNLMEYAAFMNARDSAYGWGKRPQFANPKNLGEGTNWQDYLFHKANMNSHSLTVSGGDQVTTYLLNANYLNQDGIAVGSSFKREAVRLNLDNKTTKWLKIGTSIQVSNVDEDVTSSGSDVVANTLRQTPDVPAYNADGSFGTTEAIDRIYAATGFNGNNRAITTNPLATMKYHPVTQNRKQGFGSIYADITFLKGLTLHTEASGSIDYGLTKQFAYKNTAILADIQTNSNFYSSKSSYWRVNTYLNYNFNPLSKVNVNATVGHEANEFSYKSVNYGTTDLLSDLTIEDIADGDNNAYVRTGGGSGSKESYFGRLNLSIADRYLLTGTARRDASSDFAPESNSVWSYSGSLAWKLSNEQFIKNIRSIDELKLRVGYGSSANGNVGQYNYGATLTQLGTAFGPGVRINNIPNRDAKWELTNGINIGLDVSMFNKRVNLTIDGYHRKTDNLLTRISLPYYFGVGAQGDNGNPLAPVYNAGSLTNKGFEFSLNTVNVRNKDFEWSSTVTFSRNTNKINALSNPKAQIIRFVNDGAGTQYPFSILVAGQGVGEFYGYQTEGIFTSAADLQSHPKTLYNGSPNAIDPTGMWFGDTKFKDVNGDGVIDDNDRTFLGSAIPKFQYGVSNNFTYKNFELNIFVNGNYGNKIFNFFRVLSESPINSYVYAKNIQNYAVIGMIDHAGSATDVNNLRVENPGTTINSLNIRTQNNNNRFSDKYLEDGTYLRIKNIILSYTVPQKYIKRLRLSNVKVYMNVQNIATFTKYTGYDPEVGSYSQTDGNMPVSGVDYGRYPSPRTVTFGLNIGL